MTLDVQVLHANIRHLAPKGSKLDFGFAETFVKAFYIPANELNTGVKRTQNIPLRRGPRW